MEITIKVWEWPPKCKGILRFSKANRAAISFPFSPSTSLPFSFCFFFAFNHRPLIPRCNSIIFLDFRSLFHSHCPCASLSLSFSVNLCFFLLLLLFFYSFGDNWRGSRWLLSVWEDGLRVWWKSSWESFWAAALQRKNSIFWSGKPLLLLLFMSKLDFFCWCCLFAGIQFDRRFGWWLIRSFGFPLLLPKTDLLILDLIEEWFYFLRFFFWLFFQGITFFFIFF